MPLKHPRILAHHLILSSYGFWLANDPRGSGSPTLHEQKFAPLGPLHPGRKPHQPTREELRTFYTQATPLLEHKPLWFNAPTREIISQSFAAVIQRCNYTIWSCFIGSNHAHLCIRYHRDRYETMWTNLTAQSRSDIAAAKLITDPHPLWADRPYSVFLHSPEDIHRTITYINENPARENLPPQSWSFVKPYNG